MDFWAQHKDFVLKILAGFGLFLVALIARGIVYGDELEQAMRKNTRMASEVKRMQVGSGRAIQELRDKRGALARNAETMIGQIGWKGTPDELELRLVQRILGYLRRYRGDPQLPDAARQARDAIKANLNGGFGELRLSVEDEMGDEASERNIRVEAGFGFQNVTELEATELERYLLQLELATRIIRYAIDASVDAVEEVRIETRRSGEVIPGANPDFLREFPVRVRFRSTQAAAVKLLARLDRERPSVPIRGLRIDRAPRPRDHVIVDLTALAVVATLDDKVPFALSKEKSQ